MFTIERKLLGINMKQVYFPDPSKIGGVEGGDLVGVTQAVAPIEGCHTIETLHLDLTQDREKIFSDMSRTTRRQIRMAEKRYTFTPITIERPTDTQIYEFRDYYNTFARNKGSYLIRSFNLLTLKKLRDRNKLVLTKMVDEEEEIMAYRAYISHEGRAMALYISTLFRMADNTDEKRRIGSAHRYLKWCDMTWFKEKGYHTFDHGGLTNDEGIRNFKLGFGGKVVHEYSGYVPRSVKGRFLVEARKRLVEK
ncbi:hypothetical protein N781_14170 [Pontibacillus halophilus JSM 076056 = DSM 19796]|uniref:BioF2-like acetyltransferase domain-containing protein n=1 Tax=Pontibacillus halophilus JSM 076056 = DSM 19796 TaxID=1385510 RepID=A0A0A5GPI9_9BACI|nr:hypothetical protein [Pontibacillus halophilus]KGX93060.1 hypothetical protein N781_14170 [Pontibacillus halophilus JSM 076056 = DSM 19796]